MAVPAAAVVAAAVVEPRVLALAQVVVRRALRGQLPLLVRLLVLAHLVVELEGPLQHLISRQSFSAAMARNTP